MEKQIKKPTLRFPEFIDEWKSLKLNAFFVERNESPKEQFPLFSLTIENGIIPKSGRYERSYLVNEIEFAYKVIHQDDFAFNPMNLRFGALARHKETKKVLLSKYYNIFYCNENASPGFFEYYLTSYNLIQFYNKMATGSLMEKKRVHYLEFIKFSRLLPTLPEQQKIASFLTAVDTRLTQLKEKKSLLEQYKKGLMQKIFNREIRFRDKDGNAFPEWEKKKLGDVYSFLSTNSFSREFLNYETGKVKNIHYGDIHTKFQSLFNIQNEYVPYVNPNIDLSKLNPDNYCKEGDLIIADASEDYADVGKSIEIVNLNNEKTVAGLHTIQARPDLAQLSIGFGGFMMKSANIRSQIMIIAQGIKVLSISVGRLSKILIVLPCPEEQAKIANFLTSIDEKINQCQLQIEKTQLYKKGLLQNMFC